MRGTAREPGAEPPGPRNGLRRISAAIRNWASAGPFSVRPVPVRLQPITGGYPCRSMPPQSQAAASSTTSTTPWTAPRIGRRAFCIGDPRAVRGLGDAHSSGRSNPSGAVHLYLVDYGDAGDGQHVVQVRYECAQARFVVNDHHARAVCGQAGGPDPDGCSGGRRSPESRGRSWLLRDPPGGRISA